MSGLIAKDFAATVRRRIAVFYAAVQTIMIALDLAKNVFQVHGADGAGRVVPRKRLCRGQVLEFLRGRRSLLFAGGREWCD